MLPSTAKTIKLIKVEFDVLAILSSMSTFSNKRTTMKSFSLRIIYFYEFHNSRTRDEEKPIKRVDLGIGISHFHQAVLEHGLSGDFKKLLREIPKNTKYIIFWSPKIGEYPEFRKKLILITSVIL